MSDLRTAAQQALEALEQSATTVPYEGFGMVHREAERKHQAAITALRAALAQQAEPVQEPVAWRWGYRSVTTGEMDWRGYVEIAAHPNLRSPEIIMESLYTAPPRRKPLTKESLLHIYNQLPNWGMDMDSLPQGLEKFARAVERAHGIKE